MYKARFEDNGGYKITLTLFGYGLELWRYGVATPTRVGDVRLGRMLLFIAHGGYRRWNIT